jgi:hypothetical protein
MCGVPSWEWKQMELLLTSQRSMNRKFKTTVCQHPELRQLMRFEALGLTHCRGRSRVGRARHQCSYCGCCTGRRGDNDFTVAARCWRQRSTARTEQESQAHGCVAAFSQEVLRSRLIVHSIPRHANMIASGSLNSIPLEAGGRWWEAIGDDAAAASARQATRGAVRDWD